MHVIATCFKQNGVVRDVTGESPLYVHDNSDFETYSTFFNHMRIKLMDTDTTKLVIGSDEKLALANAISKAFKDSNHILCKRHLYKDTKQKLVDDCIDKESRQTILDMIFGDEGLVTADDSICFEVKSEEIETRLRDSTKFLNYVEK